MFNPPDWAGFCLPLSSFVQAKFFIHHLIFFEMVLENFDMETPTEELEMDLAVAAAGGEEDQAEEGEDMEEEDAGEEAEEENEEEAEEDGEDDEDGDEG